jgi:hypothetical protein
VPAFHTPRRALKRGALLASANWPVALIQASADSLFKMVVAVPFIGGLFLVALVVGAEPGALLDLGAQDLAATIVALLLSRSLVLMAFVAAVAVAATGGSVLVFFVKGGAVSVMVEAERRAAAVEEHPFGQADLSTARQFSLERFLASSRALLARYVAAGLTLVAVYGASTTAYLVAIFGWGPSGDRWWVTLVVTIGFVAWITLVNWLYVLVQVAIAAEDCGLGTAVGRVWSFLRLAGRPVAGVFLVVLGLIAVATAASLAASAALGLVAWVPFVWFAAWPLQLLAWLLRAVVFQYLGLASLGAYLTLYREFMGDGVSATGTAAAYPVLGTAHHEPSSAP